MVAVVIWLLWYVSEIRVVGWLGGKWDGYVVVMIIGEVGIAQKVGDKTNKTSEASRSTKRDALRTVHLQKQEERESRRANWGKWRPAQPSTIRDVGCLSQPQAVVGSFDTCPGGPAGHLGQFGRCQPSQPSQPSRHSIVSDLRSFLLLSSPALRLLFSLLQSSGSLLQRLL